MTLVRRAETTLNGDCVWELTREDTSTYCFDSNGLVRRLQHPNGNALTIAWEADGRPVGAGAPFLDLEALQPSPRTVTVSVVDPTSYVRDPLIRDTSFSATRTWRVDASATAAAGVVLPTFTSHTQTERPLAGDEVVYVSTSHPTDRVFNVTWHIDGEPIANATGDRTLALSALDLSPGTHQLRATVADPGNVGATETLDWTVDNTLPTVEYTLSEPVRRTTDPDGTPHFHFAEKFTLKLSVKLAGWLKHSTKTPREFKVMLPKDVTCDASSLKGDQVKIVDQTLTGAVTCSGKPGTYEIRGNLSFGYDTPNGGAGMGTESTNFKFIIK